MIDLAAARKILADFLISDDRVVDRPQVEAFAMLSAFCQHYPKRLLDGDLLLVEQTQIIFEKEKSRYFKQRRMALTYLARTLPPPVL